MKDINIAAVGGVILTRTEEFKQYLLEHKRLVRDFDTNHIYEAVKIEYIIDDMEDQTMAEPIPWIPCSERLPEERDWILATFKEKDTGFILIPSIATYIGRKTDFTTDDGWLINYVTDREDCNDYYKKLECVAWMPLPEPYKEDIEMGGEKE